MFNFEFGIVGDVTAAWSELNGFLCEFIVVTNIIIAEGKRVNVLATIGLFNFLRRYGRLTAARNLGVKCYYENIIIFLKFHVKKPSKTIRKINKLYEFYNSDLYKILEYCISVCYSFNYLFPCKLNYLH